MFNRLILLYTDFLIRAIIHCPLPDHPLPRDKPEKVLRIFTGAVKKKHTVFGEIVGDLIRGDVFLNEPTVRLR